MSESSITLTGIGMGGITYSKADLKVTEDILKSQDELLALYWKWISIYRPNVYDFGNDKFKDLDFQKMFTKRFDKFKDTARMIHKVNNTKEVYLDCGI
ncbi:hypothetical protein MKX01_002454 [Papaver californicum]|nr:hypothetical protein MKX01_002454 [Papaver californicum]